jgi:hypothetical protein
MAAAAARAGSASFPSLPRRERSRRSPPGRCATSAPGREYLVSDSGWKPYSALTAAGSSGTTSRARGAPLRPADPPSNPVSLGRRNRCDEREDHRPAAGRFAGHRNSDASTSSRWDRRRRTRAGGWSPPRRISSTLGTRSDAACHVVGACATTPRCSELLQSVRGATFRRGGSRRRRLESPSPADGWLWPDGPGAGRDITRRRIRG